MIASRAIKVNADGFRAAVKFPGLTPGSRQIPELVKAVIIEAAVLCYKYHRPYLWIAFIGGTGTGKSTLFNALCDRPLSAAGVERPKTKGPIAYAPAGSMPAEDFPIQALEIQREPENSSGSEPFDGKAGLLRISEHERKGWEHIILLDTPDLDSVEDENRAMAQDLYRLADGVIFVTSQEKYADELPARFLKTALAEKEPVFILLNKTQQNRMQKDLLKTFSNQGLTLHKDQIWPLPYLGAPVVPQMAEQPEFRNFSERLQQALNAAEVEVLRNGRDEISACAVKDDIDRLWDCLQNEYQAGQKWLGQLDTLKEQTGQELLDEVRERFTAQSRRFIQTEIRRLFERYDVLAGPRRIIGNVIGLPLRWLGLIPSAQKTGRRQALAAAKRKQDPAPVLRAIERLNRSVLDTLSPSEQTAPFFDRLRQPDLILGDAEIRRQIEIMQAELAAWLELKFHALAQGLAWHKRWGIYSTSILWGILIIVLETTLGGGFSVLDAALDSALAPFVTKGAVELFAYQEIQKIARRLARRYQDGLFSILDAQRDRYARCLNALIPQAEDWEHLKAFRACIANL